MPQTALWKWQKPLYEDEDDEEVNHGTGFTSGDDVEDIGYLSRSEVDDDEENSDFDADGEHEEEEGEEDDILREDSMFSRSSCFSVSLASSVSLLFHVDDYSEGCKNENGNGVHLRCLGCLNGRSGLVAVQKWIQKKKGSFQVYISKVRIAKGTDTDTKSGTTNFVTAQNWNT